MNNLIDPTSFLSNELANGGRCLYMPNGGNLGDNLIARATIQAFQRAGIRWEFLRGGRESVRAGDIVVYGGGGSLVPLYKGGVDCLRFLSSLNCRVFVLPHTVRGHEDFWASAHGFTAFCRDKASLDYLGEFAGVEAIAAHDMATGLDLSADPFTAVRNLRAWHVKNETSSTLLAFRGDGESGSIRAGRSLDVSDLAHPPLSSVESIYAHATFFLSVIAAYGAVETDRLHISIAAGLLGIPTALHDNNYGKNAAVFEQTLRFKFPTIQLAS